MDCKSTLLPRVNNTRNGDLRRCQQAKYWATLPIHKGQILKVPPEIIFELGKREKEFEELNKQNNYRLLSQHPIRSIVWTKAKPAQSVI